MKEHYWEKKSTDRFMRIMENIFMCSQIKIPRRVSIAESSAVGKSIFKYDSKSDGANAYYVLAREVDLNAKREIKRHRDSITR